jgi:hypothetical protein
LRILQKKILAKTKEIRKDLVTEMDMADFLKKGIVYPSDLDLAALKSLEYVVNQPSKTPNNGQKYSTKDTTTVLPEDLNENKSDESNASEKIEDDWMIAEYPYQVWITQNWAFADIVFLTTRDRLNYSQAVMRVIMSDHTLTPWLSPWMGSTGRWRMWTISGLLRITQFWLQS